MGWLGRPGVEGTLELEKIVAGGKEEGKPAKQRRRGKQQRCKLGPSERASEVR